MVALFSSSAGFASYLGVFCPATLQDTQTHTVCPVLTFRPHVYAYCNHKHETIKIF